MATETAAALLRALDEKATPRPWKSWAMDSMWDKAGDSNMDHAVLVARFFTRDDAGKPRTWDLELANALRNALPEMAAYIEALEREVAACRKELTALREAVVNAGIILPSLMMLAADVRDAEHGKDETRAALMRALKPNGGGER